MAMPKAISKLAPKTVIQVQQHIFPTIKDKALGEKYGNIKFKRAYVANVVCQAQNHN